MDVMDLNGLQALFRVLSGHGYVLVGPTVRDGAIVYDSITAVDDLPKGWGDAQEPASYSILLTREESYFNNYVVGPHSWKRFLYPPRVKLFAAEKTGKGFEFSSPDSEPPKYAFIGVRSCELQAMAVQDKVFSGEQYADPTYLMRRRQVFVVAVNCVRPGGNCFCVSMQTGPKAQSGFDLAMTEIVADGQHYFVVESASEQGESVLAEVPRRPAGRVDTERATAATDAAATHMGKTLTTQNLQKVLNDNLEHSEWEDVAKRCLACANCTMVCPTCFCSTVEDVTDLSGDHALWSRAGESDSFGTHDLNATDPPCRPRCRSHRRSFASST